MSKSILVLSFLILAACGSKHSSVSASQDANAESINVPTVDLTSMSQDKCTNLIKSLEYYRELERVIESSPNLAYGNPVTFYFEHFNSNLIVSYSCALSANSYYRSIEYANSEFSR